MARKYKQIKLTEEQKSSLKEGFTHGKSPLFRRKCQCILLCGSGKTSLEIADFFQVSRHSVLLWIRLWESDGIKGLELKPGRGRKAKLKLEEPKHVKVVKELVDNEPNNLRFVTSKIESDLNIKVSKKTLKRFLKNLNIDGNALDDE